MSKTQNDIPSVDKVKDKFDIVRLVTDDPTTHIDYSKVAEQLEVILQNTRKVSKQQHLPEDLKYAFRVIDAINNLNEFQIIDSINYPKCIFQILR